MTPVTTSGHYVPDILDCLAQLSNDEVPTPPKLAHAMLDILPANVWEEPDYRWLDPACKSGIFLREVAVRLLEGLAGWEPNFERRRDHIYRDMLWGTSITEMTGMIARRSLYCSRDASGSHSVVRLDAEAGNLPFIRTSHEFVANRTSCVRCGASPEIERGEDRENHAYSFVHGAFPTKEMSAMQFDVIVGNPPYQLKGGGGGTNDSPVYHFFVRQAIALNPRHIVMVTPSRWFTGGRGLDEFRASMLQDRRLAKIVDNPKLFDCFPGVEIKGGVSYFLWSREHDGDCEFSTRVDGVITSTQTRDLRTGGDVLVRSNEAAPIVSKVMDANDGSWEKYISPDTPFGLATNFDRFLDRPTPTSVLLIRRGLEPAWIEREDIAKNPGWIDAPKVLIPKAGDGHGRIPASVLGIPVIVDGSSVCTQTFLIARLCASETEARRAAAFLGTKFARFLVHQRKASQDNYADSFRFVPDLPMDRLWTDEMLYDRYALSEHEIEFVEDQIREMGTPTELATA